MFPPNQRQIIDQAKFTYSPLDKAFEKQTKPIEEQGRNEQMLSKIKTKDQRLQQIKKNQVEALTNKGIYK